MAAKVIEHFLMKQKFFTQFKKKASKAILCTRSKSHKLFSYIKVGFFKALSFQHHPQCGKDICHCFNQQQ